MHPWQLVTVVRSLYFQCSQELTSKVSSLSCRLNLLALDCSVALIYLSCVPFLVDLLILEVVDPFWRSTDRICSTMIFLWQLSSILLVPKLVNDLVSAGFLEGRHILDDCVCNLTTLPAHDWP